MSDVTISELEVGEEFLVPGFFHKEPFVVLDKDIAFFRENSSIPEKGVLAKSKCFFKSTFPGSFAVTRLGG